MRLIDADALLKSFDVAWMIEYDETGCGMERKAIPIKTVENAPTIDAVPVVRCRECIHAIKFRTGQVSCRYHDWCRIHVDANGYCDHGEKEDDNATD